MALETTRRGFLAGLLGVTVIAVIPKAIQTILPEVVSIDPWAIQAPPGTTYQWVRTALLGTPDPENVQKRLDNGWVFVPPAVHPGAPLSTVNTAIETSGLILMQKPTALVQETLAQERAPRMDQDHRVVSLACRYRAEDEAVATVSDLVQHLHGIGYTPRDVELFFKRKGIS